jgi:hypothetical protein
VKSIFRSCSTFWGNDCSEDNSIVNCKTSCKGNYCNNFTIDDSRIEELCERFQCETNGLTIFTVDIPKTLYIITLVIVVIGYLS